LSYQKYIIFIRPPLRGSKTPTYTLYLQADRRYAAESQSVPVSERHRRDLFLVENVSMNVF
jgi:hypothetical protein